MENRVITDETLLSEEVRSLQLQVKQLEAKLKETEMARDAYNCLIDLAEEKFHIPVRKNSAAK